MRNPPLTRLNTSSLSQMTIHGKHFHVGRFGPGEQEAVESESDPFFDPGFDPGDPPHFPR